MLLGLAVQAQEIRDIEVTVRLQRDGSALVTQKWDVNVVSGTEWYIPVNGAKPRYIHDLSVVENGIVYESDGRRWKSDRSLAQKTHRCGILEKSGGAIELCWGQGPYGDHVYEASFVIDHLVQAFDDYDGFNWQFLNDEWSTRPKHASVTLINESGHPGDSSSVKGWGFGFIGELTFSGDTLRAESTERFRYESSMIIMMRFDKGIFEPQTHADGSFTALQERAFEGSDYGSGKKKTLEDIIAYIIGGGFIFILVLGPLLFVIYLVWQLWMRITGKHYKTSVFGASKITEWYREAPLDGSLAGTYSVLAEGDHFSKKKDFVNLVGAYFLRWIQEGFIRPEPDPKNDKRINLVFTRAEGEPVELEESMERKVYAAALEAAGSNRILEANEFRRWSEKHYKQVVAWPDAAKADGGPAWRQRTQEERRRVVGFRNFLKDFTLVDQREAGEVRLWKDYLVYAQLFGVADKVAESLKKLYPKQFDEFVQQNYRMADYSSMRYVLTNINRSSSSMMSSALSRQAAARAAATRSSGGGGYSSFGGGGGFSGGGHGGGSR